MFSFCLCYVQLICFHRDSNGEKIYRNSFFIDNKKLEEEYLSLFHRFLICALYSPGEVKCEVSKLHKNICMFELSTKDGLDFQKLAGLTREY